MKFGAILAATATLLSSAAAIQTIFVGVKEAECGSASVNGGRYALWFSDSPACKESTVTGYPGYATNLCDGEYSILGHDGITFTGCDEDGIPTGVSDGGNPALNCECVDDANTYRCNDDDCKSKIQPILYCK
jgi:hypothetical protein